MSTQERLQAVQAALKERGVQDVKFCFSDPAATPLSHLVTDATEALQAYIDGRVDPLPDLGDSVRNRK